MLRKCLVQACAEHIIDRTTKIDAAYFDAGVVGQLGKRAIHCRAH
jgi:hypothetical protein